jgi:hypothetical protein
MSIMIEVQNKDDNIKPVYIMDRKKVLPRKKLCRFGILKVLISSDSAWSVDSDSGNSYTVAKNEFGQLTCTCPFGKKQMESGDFSKECRHMKAVKQSEQQLQEQRIREARKESTQALIKKGYLQEDRS